ncbi:MAG: chorismate synthase [Calditrichaeota bacterium]|nr:MAG: chorismate synthase [Calditrichota bacterium]
MRYFTAGESHGPGLTAIIEGLPARVPVDLERVNHELYRRQQGHGRGRRQKIEQDAVEVLSGIRFRETLGSPVSVLLRNKDWKNWTEIMAVEEGVAKKRVSRPRPGHADLSGALKYDFRDMRNVLERSSARETAMRVAVGALVRELLYAFDIHIYSHVLELGPIRADREAVQRFYSGDINQLADASPVRCLDPAASDKMVAHIDAAKKEGDTLGGIIEVVIRGVPPGLGSYVQWDRKLDAQLAMALMSVQAVKGVEVGIGFEAARRPGSRAHDPIHYEKDRGFYHKTNNAGGIEGGMSTGEDIVLHVAKKPIPTLMKALHSVDIDTKKSFKAHVERSDVTAVPAAAVICEAVVAPVIANALMEKLGRDTLPDMLEAYRAYQKRVAQF